MSQAIQGNASDIHFNFSSQGSSIQFRTIQGLVKETVRKADISLYHYLKFLSKLDLSSSMKPQSGTFSIILNEQEWYCRFSALETFSAKSGVLRILNLAKIETLDDVSFQDQAISDIRELLTNSNGLILFSGSTGSGKSTTLFTALSEVSDKSIYTLEDPIECLYHNMMQIQINEANQLDFEAGIKQLLRHDPDIIVLGEIRSPVEAVSLIRTSLSGHMICSTIHSASPYQTIVRLLDFGCNKDDLRMINFNIVFQELVVVQHQRSAKLQILKHHEIVEFLKHSTI